MGLLILTAPAANLVYAAGAGVLTASEVEILTGVPAEPVTRAGVGYLRLDAEPTPALRRALSGHSAFWALFAERDGRLLEPVEMPAWGRFDRDLVTIPKYPGKTNEQFTHLLLNVTLAAADLPHDRRWTVLDPLAGRGTTLAHALIAGHDAAGVEVDAKAVEAMAAFWRTWLRRKRLKHSADMTPVRREGRSLGKRFDVEVRDGDADPARLTVFTGDTRQSAALFGKRRFEAIVTDAPYGVVHGSENRGGNGSENRGGTGGRRRQRTAADLLAEAVPVWVSQLVPGGALGVSWNTLQMTREDLAAVFTKAGLAVRDDGPWRRLAHRVDASIQRDVLVGALPR